MKAKYTPRYIRVSLAYADSDFQKDAKQFHGNYLTLLKDTDLDQSFIDNVKDGYVRATSIKKFAPQILEKYEILLHYYSLTETELINYYLGNTGILDDSVAINLPDATDSDSTYRISISPDARLEEVIKAFYEVQRLRKSLGHKITRQKGPQDPLLLYRLRQMKIKGFSYKEMSEMIATDTLPGYNITPDLKSDWDPEELKQYYYKYKKYVDKTAS